MSRHDLKLNVLLAKTDSLASMFYTLLKAYVIFFKTKQGAFKGEKSTYEPLPDTFDEPSKRGVALVQTTVSDKLDYLRETSKDYIDSMFSQEKTNASGQAVALLIVEGASWGEFTTLELLKLKTLLENGDLISLYSTIPVRSDAEQWAECDDGLYLSKGIYMSPLITGTHKTTEKESYILEDPNVANLSAGKSYTPSVANKTTTVPLGEFTHRRYSGEWSHRERAELLRRRQTLHTAVIEALKVANEVEALESEMTAEKIFRYLHEGV